PVIPKITNTSATCGPPSVGVVVRGRDPTAVVIGVSLSQEPFRLRACCAQGLAPTSPEAGDASHPALEPSPQRSAAPADRRAAVMKKGSSRPTSDATISSLPCPTKMVLGESDIRLRAPNDSTTMPTAPTPTEIQANTSRPSTANTITIASPANAAS